MPAPSALRLAPSTVRDTCVSSRPTRESHPNRSRPALAACRVASVSPTRDFLWRRRNPLRCRLRPSLRLERRVDTVRVSRRRHRSPAGHASSVGHAEGPRAGPWIEEIGGGHTPSPIHCAVRALCMDSRAASAHNADRGRAGALARRSQYEFRRGIWPRPRGRRGRRASFSGLRRPGGEDSTSAPARGRAASPVSASLARSDLVGSTPHCRHAFDAPSRAILSPIRR